MGWLAKGWLKEAVENDGETPDIAAHVDAARPPISFDGGDIGRVARLAPAWHGFLRPRIGIPAVPTPG
jgi:hypothetical protein